MDRSVLARKPMTELRDIASHLQMRGFQKLRKADLIEAIVTHATGGGEANGSTSTAPDDQGAPESAPDGAEGRTRTRTRARAADRADEEAEAEDREEIARKVLPPGERGGAADSPTPDQQDLGLSDQATGEDDSEDGGGRGRQVSGSTGGSGGTGGSGNGSTRRRSRGQSADQSEAAPDAEGTSRSSRRGRSDAQGAGNDQPSRQDSKKGSAKKNPSSTSSSSRDSSAGAGSGQASDDQDGGPRAAEEQGQQVGPDDDESSASRKRRNRRDRRKRNRDRAEQETPSGDEQGEVRAGILDILPEGYGFLRTTGYLPGDRDVYVSQGQIRKHGLRRGDVVQGPIRQQRNNEKVPALHHVQKVNGEDLESGRAPERVEFRDLVPLYPSERIRLETDKAPTILRSIDLLCPIGKGQRALLVSPPGAGRTDTITGMGRAIAENHPEAHLMVLLIDERPEDVTEVQRALPGEVIASTFNRPIEDHTQIAELALERAKRLVELGHDVIILLDSLTRLARAYGGGGVDGVSLHPAKRFFGAARNIEDGGSLTIIAATLIGTGAATDDAISEEFVGNANAVAALQGALPPHLRPALDVGASGTRREELMVDDEDLQAMWALRRSLESLPPSVASQTLSERVAGTTDNRSLITELQKDGSE